MNIRPTITYDIFCQIVINLIEEIEFVPEGWSILEPTNERTGRSFAQDASQHPKLGASSGLRGEKSDGTLGAFFTLNCRSTEHRGFLTTYHVVAPPESALQSIKDKAGDEGTLYRTDLADDATKTSLHCFAMEDTEASRAQIDDVATALGKEIDGIEADQGKRAEYGLDP
ncbi:hypothetical protein MMC22_008436 [Lobaria immixta]|nr:hypothetical protein [Lobaria immixta]